ncbi:MAG: ECF transporter S component [Anaerovoracaceae bacterium]
MQKTETAIFKTNSKTLVLAINGISIALVFLCTWLINLRLPIAANGGLIHMGNVALFLVAIIFGKKTGAIAGAFGMALFDLMGGWFLWAPFTFIIVGLMGYAVGKITEGRTGIGFITLSIIVACAIKIAGYYAAEAVIFGNWAAPIASIPGNLVQIGVAAVIVIPFAGLIKKQVLKCIK